jgi:hypothetical protein
MHDVKKLAAELVRGLDSADELVAIARDGVKNTFFGDWSEARGIKDTARLRGAMKTAARALLREYARGG